ncbi:MAG: hypothetical protein GY708_25470 [Actinomycetia bacterium]|nr:hypothetical protein [Actinomycetes bacterium]MCP4961870.1 hypothetical protein [Actinomycetes bacterium]
MRSTDIAEVGQFRIRWAAMEIDLLSWRPTPDHDRASLEEALEQACDAKDLHLSRLATQAVAQHTHRMRAATTLVAGLGFDPDSAISPLPDELTNAAVAVELVHIGAVTHDDVIDDVFRRGDNPTVNADAGNLQAILAGDFLMARASEYAATHGTRVAQILAETIGWISEGRARQLQQTGEARPTPTERLDTLDIRHASLHDTAAVIGALVTGTHDTDGFGSFGRHLGMAMAIHEDVRRLAHGDPSTGADNLDDLRRGFWTLPATLAGPDLIDSAQSGDDLDAVHNRLLGEPLDEALSIARDHLDKASGIGSDLGLLAGGALDSIGAALDSLTAD